MRKLARRLLQILDGTPAVYGKKQRGQSIVEMAVITPLLIILVTGIVEIGWLAERYLTLQEVTKQGARRGTVLTGDFGPIAWDDNALLSPVSILPASMTDGNSIDPEAGSVDPGLLAQRETWREEIRNENNCLGGALPLPYSQGFYFTILCRMLESMEPLEIRDNGIDDIIISVFAVQTVNNGPYDPNDPSAGDYDFSAANYSPEVGLDNYRPGFIPIVVGRYPSNTNECNVRSDGTVDNSLERDPFDYIEDGTSNPKTRNLIINSSSVTVNLELLGYDNTPEQQRGWSYTGQRKVDPVEVGGVEVEMDCWGSDWTVYDIQELLQVPGFQMTPVEVSEERDSGLGGEDFGRLPDGTDEDLGRYLPNQGLILVEIYWQHDLLLDLPVFSPVLDALGDDETTLHVWSAFPVPAAEPNIQFHPPQD